MGFWIRFAAWVIDFIIVAVVSLILTRLPYWGGSVLSFLLSWLYYWLFIGLKGQTPGKMAFGVKVVNARGEVPGLGYAALREIIGKFISGIALGLGYLWIAWDPQKQGWHDKIASTYVIKAKSG